MSQQWHAKIEDETRGPMSTLELKQLVFKNEILPDSLVRLNADGKWVKAAQIKGLKFPSEDGQASSSAVSSEQWVVKQGDKLIGPIGSSQLQRLVETGQVKRNTYVRRDSDGRWIEAKDLEGLSFVSRSSRTRSEEVPRSVRSSAEKDSGNPYQSTAFSEDERPKAAVILSSSELEKTKKGLMTVYYGICAVLLAGVVGIFVGIFSSFTGIALAAVVGLVGIVAGSSGYIAILVGQIMCIAVPRESNARRPCQIALGLQIASIALYVFSNYILPLLIPFGLAGLGIFVFFIGLLAVVNPIITLAGYLYFLSFLKYLSIYINRTDLSAVSAKIAVRVIVTSVMLFFLLVSPSLLLLPTLGTGFIALFRVFAIVVAIAFIFTFLKYANHVREVAKAISVQ